MIGIFDSGHGGLTIMKAVAERFPAQPITYLGDHAHAPYGDRTGPEIVKLTADGCAYLFDRGCKLVLLGCNTATAVAGRTLQQDWLAEHYPHHKILGVIAPVVETATQTPWYVKEPQFPQKYNTDTFALFATTATVQSGVFATEIHKRCPHAQVVSQACPQLVPMIEAGAPRPEMARVVKDYVQTLMAKAKKAPDWAILGCTHYPLVADLFRAALPPQTRLMDQPTSTATALEDYLGRHPEFMEPNARYTAENPAPRIYLTTGDVEDVTHVASLLLHTAVNFQQAK
jgi:glutamate racemase